MAFKVFADANILLDFTLKREGYDEAKKIFQFSLDGDIQLFITPAILHISAYWIAKAYGKKTAKELLLNLLADVKIIDASHEITINALCSDMDDVEDALQYFTAIYHHMDYFITGDKELLQSGIPILPVYTPEVFLKEVIML